jgi:hypothetical protein
MSQILVVPHDDRWAVVDRPDGPPIAEFETREAAELDARARARESGAEYVVDDAAPAHPERDTPDTEFASDVTDPDPTSARNTNPRGGEMQREPQAGL